MARQVEVKPRINKNTSETATASPFAARVVVPAASAAEASEYASLDILHENREATSSPAAAAAAAAAAAPAQFRSSSR